MNKLKVILGVGLIVRIILSLIGYHSDVQPFDFAGFVISQGHILDFYDYLSTLPKDNYIVQVYPAYLFNYPPLVYFFLGLMSLIFTFPTDWNLHHGFLFNISQVLGDPRINLHLLLLKLPYFFFDGLVAWLIYRLFENPKQKLMALILWVFNPINLYATYLIGQFDVIPTSLVLLALWMVNKTGALKYRNLLFAAIALGVGGAFKIYPLFLLLPLSLLTPRWWDRIKLISLGVFFYFLPVLPFISSEGYRANALLANQTLKSLYPVLPISGGESVFIFLAVLMFFYYLFIDRPAVRNQLWKQFFIVLLLFFMFTHYHVQWFVWITPFIIFELVSTNFKHWIAASAVLVQFIGAVMFFDPGLSVGLFSALNPLLYNPPSLWQSLGLNPDYNFARSLCQTILFGTGIFYLYYYFPHEQT